MATERTGPEGAAGADDDGVGLGSGRAPDDDPSGATTRAVWILIGTIAAAKTTTLAVIVWASGSGETVALVAATLPPWFLAAGALASGPILFRLRLRRVRAHRDRLRRAEWMLPPERTKPPHRPRPFRPKPRKAPVAQPR